MKICLINFHFSINFGAVLQCLALKRVLEKEGNIIQVIDYRPEYMVQQYKAIPKLFSGVKRANLDYIEKDPIYRSYRMFRRFFRTLFSYVNVKNKIIREKKFEAFIRKNLNLTKKFESLEELRKTPPEADIYIAGSDQLWNPYVTNAGLDPAMFLDFGSKEVKKIIYAVSPCQLDIKKYEGQLMKLTNPLNAISLREVEKKQDLEILTKKKISICLDPTLLLNLEDYNEYETEVCHEKKPYILVYAFTDKGNTKVLYEVVKKVQNKKKLPVIDVSFDSHHWPYNVKREASISPGQFLRYVAKADFVITNSFHGTVFSIIYKKQFFAIAKQGTSSRVTELLGNLGMSDRLVNIQSDIQAICKNQTNYDDVLRKLHKLRIDSQQYLQESILTSSS